jgi:SAM-dependent methyltransferase
MPYDPEYARLYNWLVHGEAEPEATPEEIEFLEWAFRDLARRPVSEVLDAGCGQGRVLLPLLRKGYRVTGLDNSEEMLAACRERLAREGLEARLIRESMDRLDADQAFDALIAMDSVICYALAPAAMQDVLGRFHRALRPGGLLVLDNWNMLGNWPLLGKAQTFSFADGDIRIRGEERNRYESFRSIWRIECTAVVQENGQRYRFRNEETLRALTPAEMQACLREAGFERVAAYPDYHREPEAASEPEQIQFVAVRSPE